MLEKLKNLNKGALIRGGLLVLAMVNSGLQLAGFDVLPFTEQDVETFITVVFNFVAMGVGYWKNNSFTNPAKQADEKLAEEKAKAKVKKRVRKQSKKGAR